MASYQNEQTLLSNSMFIVQIATYKTSEAFTKRIEVNVIITQKSLFTACYLFRALHAFSLI